MSIFTRAFWTAALERAIKTGGQSAILAIGADQFNVIAVNWAEIAGFAGGGVALSLLTSIASAQIGHTGPSLANEVAVPVPLVARHDRF